MLKQILTAATIGLYAIMPIATAHASSLTSTYTEVFSCPVPFERPDEFTRVCAGPSGFQAFLYFVEGKLDVFYAKNEKQLDNGADIIELNHQAKQPYGEKHEWRLRDGQACAAILRVYTQDGSRLVVTSLKTGKRLGFTKTNEEAHKMADKACL